MADDIFRVAGSNPMDCNVLDVILVPPESGFHEFKYIPKYRLINC